MDHYRETNLANWESRVPVHVQPQGYGPDALADDPEALSPVVRYDAARLGDLRGKRAVHLQCHIGTDTLSLARLGAEVTGLDFSPSAIAAAEAMFGRARTPGTFVVSELYDAVDALGGRRFDLVYTGVGALCWLPDIAGWARIVAELLEPGGRLFVREGHPMLWTIDDEPDAEQRLVVRYPYFTTEAPEYFVEETSYANSDVTIASPGAYSWNHGLGQIVTALLDAGLTLTGLVEHDECEWEALPWMVRNAEGRYVLPEHRERLPLMYTLTAVRPA